MKLHESDNRGRIAVKMYEEHLLTYIYIYIYNPSSLDLGTAASHSQKAPEPARATTQWEEI